jgi:hypothetical protein
MAAMTAQTPSLERAGEIWRDLERSGERLSLASEKKAFKVSPVAEGGKNLIKIS